MPESKGIFFNTIEGKGAFINAVSLSRTVSMVFFEMAIGLHYGTQMSVYMKLPVAKLLPDETFEWDPVLNALVDALMERRGLRYRREPTLSSDERYKQSLLDASQKFLNDLEEEDDA